MSIRNAIAGYACIAIIALAFIATDALEPVDRAVLSAQFGALRTWLPRPVERDVVLVGIDEESLRQMPEPFSLWHPHLGRFLQATAAGGAAAVGLDVVLPDRSFDAIVPGYDRSLLLGILVARRAAPVVLALTFDPNGQPRRVHAPFISAAGPDGTAYALLPIDSDGVVRRFDERLGTGEESVPTLAGQMARRLGASPHNGYIDFSRGSAFSYVPLHVVLAAHEAGDTPKLQHTFAGKPVLLGSVLKFEDRLGAPVNLIAWDREAINVPGVVLHAQALRNMLGPGFITPVPGWVAFALCLLVALAWFIARAGRWAAALAITGGAALAALSTWLLLRGWYLGSAPVVATLVLAAGARTVRETAVGMAERRKLRQAFSGYVSPGVMDDIMNGQIHPQLGGDNRFLCALFSDIRGYTARSESMTAQQVVQFLNNYFEQVVRLIHARGGTVMTFMGDGIMAVFGAPKSLANPCAEAFAAGRALLEYVREFNARAGVTGDAPLQIGIGLHAGDAVVGHVGSSSRHDYTAIGDVINVASRLEGVTKDAGYRLVYSKVVADYLPDAGGGTHIGLQQIKGHSPVEAYGYDKIL